MALPKNQQVVRLALRAAKPGLTVEELCCATDLDAPQVRKIVNLLPDVYIAQWKKKYWHSPQYLAVWAAADVPENAQHPKK